MRWGGMRRFRWCLLVLVPIYSIPCIFHTFFAICDMRYAKVCDMLRYARWWPWWYEEVTVVTPKPTCLTPFTTCTAGALVPGARTGENHQLVSPVLQWGIYVIGGKTKPKYFERNNLQNQSKDENYWPEQLVGCWRWNPHVKDTPALLDLVISLSEFHPLESGE